MEALVPILVIIGPPLLVALLGAWLGANRALSPALRRLGAGLVVLGLGVIALTYASFSACTPFDSDPCHGDSWTSWPEVLLGSAICLVVLIAAFGVSISRRVRLRRG